MAAGAIGPELAIVYVVRFVAVGTVTAEAHLCRQRLPMTRLALDAYVRALEPECRLRVVIEDCLSPLHRVVARRAFFAEAPAMGVAFAMAIDASLGRIAEDV